MLRNIAFVISLMLFVVSGWCQNSDNVTFTISPPPAGYPIFTPGSRDFSIGVNYTSISIPYSYVKYDIENNVPVEKIIHKDLKIKGGVVTGSYKVDYERFSVNHAGGLAVLSGNLNNMLIMSLIYRINGLAQVINNDWLSIFLFGNAGIDFSLNDSKINIPQYLPLSDPINDEVTVSVSSLISSFSGGLQMNLNAGNFIISPYGIYSYSAGNYNSSTKSSMSFDYPSSEGQIQGFGSIVFGFDILYKPAGIALSSMVQSSKDYDLVNISLRKNLGFF